MTRVGAAAAKGRSGITVIDCTRIGNAGKRRLTVNVGSRISRQSTRVTVAAPDRNTERARGVNVTAVAVGRRCSKAVTVTAIARTSNVPLRRRVSTSTRKRPVVTVTVKSRTGSGTNSQTGTLCRSVSRGNGRVERSGEHHVDVVGYRQRRRTVTSGAYDAALVVNITAVTLDAVKTVTRGAKRCVDRVCIARRGISVTTVTLQRHETICRRGVRIVIVLVTAYAVVALLVGSVVVKLRMVTVDVEHVRDRTTRTRVVVVTRDTHVVRLRKAIVVTVRARRRLDYHRDLRRSIHCTRARGEVHHLH